MSLEHQIRQQSEQLYRTRREEFGTTARGQDWKDEHAQRLRFEQLLKLFQEETDSFTLGDLGCGYGDFYAFLQGKKLDFHYQGYDILPFVVQEARLKYPQAAFLPIAKVHEMASADYFVASGIFNKTFGQIQEEDWLNYLLDTVRVMFDRCNKGVAFNVLTSYSDEEYKRSDLYYANPCGLFDFCKRNLSPHVALLHDYGLYDFTLLVRK